MSREHRRCLIIGSGPAGYTAAIYASRANLSPLLYEGIQPGGQLTQTTDVENFPGYPEGVTGPALTQDLRNQALRFGTEIRSGLATKADLSKAPYVITFEEGVEVEADTVIIATGASAKYLGLPDEEKYAGMGVSACATCDGFFYRNKKVAVVGGGDTACEEALYLASLASHVYMIVRKDYLRASDIMRQRVAANEKITVLYEHNTVGLYGEDGVEGAHLVKRLGQPDEERVDLPSMASSSLSVTTPIPSSSLTTSRSMRWATSRPKDLRRAPASLASSLLATSQTPSIVRRSPQRPQAVRRLSKLSATSANTDSKSHSPIRTAPLPTIGEQGRCRYIAFVPRGNIKGNTPKSS